jgi:hypothetical protein
LSFRGREWTGKMSLVVSRPLDHFSGEIPQRAQNDKQ